jgi:hypothetical protein
LKPIEVDNNQQRTTMQLNQLFILSVLGTAVAAPLKGTAIQEIAKRDAKLIQKAWQDVGVQYQRMDAAFQAVRGPVHKGTFGETTIPLIHNDIVKIFRDTAYTLSRSPPISMVEGTTLIMPAQTLANTQKATIARIVAAKAQIITAGEAYQFTRMLTEESAEYQQWSTSLNALMPSGQKAMGNAFSAQIVSAYTSAIEKFRHN